MTNTQAWETITQPRLLNDVSYCATISARIWSRVEIRDAESCWEWKRRLGNNGYPYISLLGRGIGPFGVHRVIFVISQQKAIRSGFQVCHKCDNRKCCNPAHYFEGTAKDNMRDCISKNRFKLPPKRPGESNKNCKLSADQVKQIIARFTPRSRGQGSREALAKEFNVSGMTIYRIAHGYRVQFQEHTENIGDNELTEIKKTELLREFVPNKKFGPGSRTFLAVKYGIAPWAVSRIVSHGTVK